MGKTSTYTQKRLLFRGIFLQSILNVKVTVNMTFKHEAAWRFTMSGSCKVTQTARLWFIISYGRRNSLSSVKLQFQGATHCMHKWAKTEEAKGIDYVKVWDLLYFRQHWFLWTTTKMFPQPPLTTEVLNQETAPLIIDRQLERQHRHHSWRHEVQLDVFSLVILSTEFLFLLHHSQ